jgi:hypothetical protein
MRINKRKNDIRSKVIIQGSARWFQGHVRRKVDKNLITKVVAINGKVFDGHLLNIYGGKRFGIGDLCKYQYLQSRIGEWV